jgi:MoaA/NifB/PqqE/SkfB family radical SAM enzyme
MRLEDIGFYTLSDHRAKTSSESSPIQRAEILVTDRCNFKCPYCRGMRIKGHMPDDLLYQILRCLKEQGTKNYRFSGGEPTVYPHIFTAVEIAAQTADHVALSTNGSNTRYVYERLLNAGVNDFSISLDACCASTGDMMSGIAGAWDRVVENIRWLSERTYVTVGIVYTAENRSEVPETIELAKSLGVADIRVIPAAQYAAGLGVDVSGEDYPILRYRLRNMESERPVRGLRETDSHYCPLVLDDVAISGREHYPCIIYLREGGKPIGRVDENIRAARKKWFECHDCHKDPICLKNCLDVCVDYNNRWLRLSEFSIPRLSSSLFDWQTWRLGAEFITVFGAKLRWHYMSVMADAMRAAAIGWCDGSSVPCRPKADHAAVMFRINESEGWCHLRWSEFHKVFSV